MPLGQQCKDTFMKSGSSTDTSPTSIDEKKIRNNAIQFTRIYCIDNDLKQMTCITKIGYVDGFHNELLINH